MIRLDRCGFWSVPRLSFRPIYVNGLPDNVKSYCKIFDVDTKLYKEINILKDYEDVQDDLYELCRSTTKWLLFFNANKFSI